MVGGPSPPLPSPPPESQHGHSHTEQTKTEMILASESLGRGREKAQSQEEHAKYTDNGLHPESGGCDGGADGAPRDAHQGAPLQGSRAVQEVGSVEALPGLDGGRWWFYCSPAIFHSINIQLFPRPQPCVRQPSSFSAKWQLYAADVRQRASAGLNQEEEEEHLDGRVFASPPCV